LTYAISNLGNSLGKLSLGNLLLLPHLFEPEQQLNDIHKAVSTISVAPSCEDIIEAKLVAGKRMDVLTLGMTETFLDVALDTVDRDHISW
jgi:hypothetical protein